MGTLLLSNTHKQGPGLPVQTATHSCDWQKERSSQLMTRVRCHGKEQHGLNYSLVCEQVNTRKHESGDCRSSDGMLSCSGRRVPKLGERQLSFFFVYERWGGSPPLAARGRRARPPRTPCGAIDSISGRARHSVVKDRAIPPWDRLNTARRRISTYELNDSSLGPA